jgi:rubrerythrin
MTSLKEEPPGLLHSLDEFFAVAYAIESDAVARYSKTAKLLRDQGEHALATVFERLAESERGHVAQINAWAEHRSAAPPEKTVLPWAIPDTHDAAPAELARSKLLTPYRALAIAVRHEERAFAFWTYIAAHAERADVKEAAERMALEELEHLSILRRERRKAYREDQQAVPPTQSVSLSSLAALERQLATHIEQHPESAGGGDLPVAIAADARGSADTLDRTAAHDDPTISLPCIPRDARDEPIAISEYLADAYLRFAEVSKNPEILSVAQQLAATAIYRLAKLRSIGGQAADVT